MTIATAISQLDCAFPNLHSQNEKLQWLSRVDMQVQREILGVSAFVPDYGPDTSLATQLLIPAPYDECYIRYMEAQIHYQNGEAVRYYNAMTLFNALYQAFARDQLRTKPPVRPGVFH